jgi:pilus assembly protein CpaB
VAYAIQTGDVIDVLISMMFVDVDPDFQSLLPNAVTVLAAPGGTEEFPSPSVTGDVGATTKKDEETETESEYKPLGKIIDEERTGQPMHVVPQENQRGRVVTQRIVDSARVLHVGTFPLEGVQTVQPTAETEEGVGAPPPQEGQAVQPQIEDPDIITLIVTPQDALALNWAMKVGADVTFTLRAPNDGEATETTSVTLQYLIDSYDVTVPTKLPYQLEPRVDELVQPQLSNDRPAAQPQQ